MTVYCCWTVPARESLAGLSAVVTLFCFLRIFTLSIDACTDLTVLTECGGRNANQTLHGTHSATGWMSWWSYLFVHPSIHFLHLLVTLKLCFYISYLSVYKELSHYYLWSFADIFVAVWNPTLLASPIANLWSWTHDLDYFYFLSSRMNHNMDCLCLGSHWCLQMADGLTADAFLFAWRRVVRKPRPP